MTRAPLSTMPPPANPPLRWLRPPVIVRNLTAEDEVLSDPLGFSDSQADLEGQRSHMHLQGDQEVEHAHGVQCRQDNGDIRCLGMEQYFDPAALASPAITGPSGQQPSVQRGPDESSPMQQHAQRVRREVTGRRSAAWTDETLAAAMHAVDSGSALCTMARHFDIPATFLRDHIYGRSLGRKRGRQGTLSVQEENDLVQYLLKMQDLGYPLTVGELRLKVAEMTETRVNPFTNNIPGAGWLRWFRRRHPKLALHSTQGLEVNRARGLCPENVRSFYHNLYTLYELHKYGLERIWNCDESGAQAGRNGGGTLVFAKRGSRAVHSIISDEREWLSILACVNASGEYIPHFYIFKGKRMRRNYIERCEDGASLAMQAKVWMTGFLFSS
jgi:hypothetical protein